MKVNLDKNIEKKVIVKKTHAANKIQKLFKNFFKSKYSATYLVDVLLFSSTKAHPKQKPYKGLYLIKEWQLEVKAPNPFPQDIYKLLIRSDKNNVEFKKGMRILMTDKNSKEWIENKASSGLSGFKIRSYETLGDTGKEYDPLDEDLMDASNVSCNFNYMETLVNLDSKTFMESIRNNKYRESECWINSITDF